MTVRFCRTVGASGLIALLALTGVGCASSSAGASVFRSDLGRARSPNEMVGMATESLQFFGYEIANATPDRVQTAWRHLPTGYRDRAMVDVRFRSNELYSGFIRIEVEERSEGGLWKDVDPPDELREQYGAMLADVRTRLQRYMTQD